MEIKPAQIPAEEAIKIRDLHKSFGNNKVLCGVSLSLRKGENVVVLGRSGSGKSVLIKCIVGLMQPDAGSIEVFGLNIPGLSHKELDHVRSRIGFLFQGSALYDSMSVRENLEFPLRRHFRIKTRDEVDALVTDALEHVGLLKAIDMMPSDLSGGMRKRIGIARTLILRPEVMLYDEPTSGLDPVTAREISGLMREVQEKYNTSSVIISHDMSCVKRTANRIIVLIDGRCHAEGAYEEIKQSNDIKVKQFFE